MEVSEISMGRALGNAEGFGLYPGVSESSLWCRGEQARVTCGNLTDTVSLRTGLENPKKVQVCGLWTWDPTNSLLLLLLMLLANFCLYQNKSMLGTQAEQPLLGRNQAAAANCSFPSLHH